MARSVVVMGVSGCGKTTVVTRLAHQLGWRALDADDLHAPEAVARMRAGQALADADRWAWLDRVAAALSEAPASGCPPVVGTLVACSALRRVYRDRLRAASPGVGFIFLDGSRAVIAERMAQRRHPYMPASLLDSQLQTLERPGADEPDVLQLPIDQALDALVQQALAALYATAPAAAEPSPRGAA